MSTCYCVRSWNGLKYFWARSSENILDVRHFVTDPLKLTWTWSTSIPENSSVLYVGFYCLYFCCQSHFVSLFPGKLSRVKRLLWCRLKKSISVPCKHFHVIVIYLMISFIFFNLCSFHVRKKWTDSIRSHIPIQEKWCFVDWVRLSLIIMRAGFNKENSRKSSIIDLKKGFLEQHLYIFSN